MGHWWVHNNTDAVRSQIPAWAAFPSGNRQAGQLLQSPVYCPLDPQSLTACQTHGGGWGGGGAVNTHWISEWVNTCHLTTVPRVYFFVGRVNCLDKYFSVDSPHALHKKKKVKFGARGWGLGGAEGSDWCFQPPGSWGKLPETVNPRSLKGLKLWGVLSSAEIACNWRARKGGAAVLAKFLLPFATIHGVKEKRSELWTLCLLFWRNRGSFRRPSGTGKELQKQRHASQGTRLLGIG